MFQFPGLAPFRVTGLATSRVSPFGHPEITASVQLPQAFRSLARPSSPLDAKAFTVCLILFDPNFKITNTTRAPTNNLPLASRFDAARSMRHQWPRCHPMTHRFGFQ